MLPETKSVLTSKCIESLSFHYIRANHQNKESPRISYPQRVVIKVILQSYRESISGHMTLIVLTLDWEVYYATNINAKCVNSAWDMNPWEIIDVRICRKHGSVA